MYVSREWLGNAQGGRSTAASDRAVLGTLPVLVRFAVSIALVVMAVCPAQARPTRSLAVRFPRVVVPSGASVELCAFVRIPRTKAFDVSQYDIRHHGVGGSFSLSHFLFYAYQGAQVDGFAPSGAPVVASRGCLDLGPDDRDNRQLLFAGAAARSRGALPPGTAIRLVPASDAQAVGVLLDANILNGTNKARTFSSLVRLRAARPGTLKRLLHPILERTAEEALFVPPGEIRSTEQSTATWNAAHVTPLFLRDAWGPGFSTIGTPAPTGDVCVVRLTGHFHKRGRFFGADFVDGQGTVTPGSGPTNPFETGRRHLFGTADYTDPGESRLSPPRLLRAGESFHYGCWIDNGVAQPARRGCEETPGVAPGTARIAGGGPAKPCAQVSDLATDCAATDAGYPERTFTGRCVAANVVAGTTPDDEACALAGFYYAATTAGTCDVGGEPSLADPP